MKLNDVFAKKTYRNRLTSVTSPPLRKRISVKGVSTWAGNETLWTDTDTLEDYLANLIIHQNSRAPDTACYYIYQALFRDTRRVDSTNRRQRHRWSIDERRTHFENWFTKLLANRSDDSLYHYDADTNEDHKIIVTIH